MEDRKNSGNGKSSGSPKKSLHDLEKEFTASDTPTDIEEVWFAGAHCGESISVLKVYHHMKLKHLDVGGGSVANDTRHSLARIPLRWMIRQCFILHTGIFFHKNMFKDIGLDPDTLYPHVRPRPPALPHTPDCLAHKYDAPLNFAKNYKITVKTEDPFVSEEEEDRLDALTPVYDQLKMVKGWWILEVLPNRHRYQRADDTWTTSQGYVHSYLTALYSAMNSYSRSINFGGPRIIPRQHQIPVKIHRTVKIRMEADGLFKDKKYKPAVKLDVEPVWVA
jgi:hypothetical protein